MDYERAPRLKKRLKPVESAQPNLSIRTTGVCDGPLEQSEEVAYLNRFN